MLCAPLGLEAQRIDESDPRAMIQANFLYQFAANSNWPVETRKGKFMIGVVGQPSIFDYLSSKYATKPIGNQTIEVIELNEVPTSVYVHILFIDKSRKIELSKAIKELKGKPTLIVTNWEGALAAGSQINFKSVEGNIRYEMNTSAMDDRKIAPGVKILQWKVD